MLVNSQKFFKKNNTETFKYDTISLLDSYQSIINAVITQQTHVFNQPSQDLEGSSFSEDIKELRRRLLLSRSAGPSQFSEKQTLKQQIRVFLEKQKNIKTLFLQSEVQIFEPLSREAQWQTRKHSCNMVFYNNALKKRQQLINYFGINFMSEEYEQIISEE